MASLKHAQVAIGDDNPDRQVAVTQWNAEHTLTGTANYLLGFNGSGSSTDVNPATLVVAASAQQVATRTALAALSTTAPVAYLREAGREGTFVWSSSNLKTLCDADPNQGIYVPPTGQDGTTGAWVRKYDNRIYAKWFGPVLDGVANDGPVILSAYTLAFALAGSSLTGYGSAAPSIVLPFTPSGINMGSTTIALTKAIATYGETGGTFGGAATWLSWSGDCNGFETHVQNCYFDGLGLKGSWTSGSPAEGEYHAIKEYYKFGYGRLYIDSWRGDGIHTNVTAGSGGDTEGNANGTYGNVLNVLSCRRGMSREGNDANACSFNFINANYCRQAGVYEASGLGNSYGAIQTSGCGVQGYGTPGISFNNGHLFYVISGQETGASTNSPPATATSNTYWGYWKDAGAATSYAPQWTSGLTWRAGGAVLVPTSQLSNATSVGYLYAESDQPPVQIAQAVLVKGGLNAAGWAAQSRYISADNRGIVVSPRLIAKGGFTNTQGINDQCLIEGTTNARDPLFIMDSGSTSTLMSFRIGGVEQAQVNALSGALYHWVNSCIFNTLGGTRLVSFDATGINIGTGIPLQNNGTTILSGAGVLQAAGVPAFAGGDVTSAGGSLVLTIPNGTITLAKQANMATGSVVYRKTAGAGAPEVQTLGTLKTDLGLTGTNGGDQTITLTGDVTGSGTGSFAATIAANAVADAKLRQSSALSVIGRSANTTGNVADITAVTDGHVLRLSGTTLGFGTVAAAAMPALTGDVTTSAGAVATTIANNAVTYAKFQQVAASSLVGNATGSLANATGITLGSSLAFSGSVLQRAALTGDVTAAADGNATTIATNIVTYAKFQQVAASSLVGNATGSLANATGITLAGGLAFSGTTLTAAGALTPTSVASTGAITSSSATAGIGYATGAGGAVTQLTSKSTAPPAINKMCGQITMNNAALAAGAKVSFAVSNSSCAATDAPYAWVVSGGTANAYRANVTAVGANSFTVTVENITAGSLSEAPVIGFFINKAVAA